jgi:hypothetical protein
LARLPGMRPPTTSSSGKASTSLFAPALSEGGPRGLAEDERICCERLKLPASLDGVGAASELRTASSKDDIVRVFEAALSVEEVDAGRECRGSLSTRRAHALRQSKPNSATKWLVCAIVTKAIKDSNNGHVDSTVYGIIILNFLYIHLE